MNKVILPQMYFISKLITKETLKKFKEQLAKSHDNLKGNS